MIDWFLCATQIEAALSQLPRGGGKASLQTRLDEVRAFFSKSHTHALRPGPCVTQLVCSSSGSFRETSGEGEPGTGLHQNESEEVPCPPLLCQHIAKSVFF